MSCLYEYNGRWLTESELKKQHEADYLLDTGRTRQKQLNELAASTKDLLIPGLSPMQQSQYVAVVAEEISRKAFTQGKVSSKEVNAVFDYWKNWFTANFNEANKRGNIKVANALAPYVNHWSTFKNLVDQYIDKRAGIKRTKDKLEEMEENEGTFEKRNYTDSSSFEIDGKDTVSGKMKRFLSFIPVGTTYLNIPSHRTYMPFDDAYNELSSILAGQPADYDTMIHRLKEVNEDWTNTVVDMLERADGQIKNEFVVAMSKHPVNMIQVLWRKVKKGVIEAFSFESNRNSKANVLIDNWYSNLKSTPLIVFDGEYKIDTNEAQSILDKIAELKKNPTKELFVETMSDIGVELTDKTVDDIFSTNKTRAVRHGQSKHNIKEMIANKGGLIKELGKVMTALKAHPVKLDDNDIIKSGDLASNIKSLAKHDAKYHKAVHSNSFRTGDKTIYTYGLSKHIISRYEKLKDPKGTLAKQLKEIAFSSTSSWIKHLANGNIGFLENFNIYTADVGQLIKQIGSKSNASKKLNHLSPAEHEFAKVSFFQNQRSISYEQNDKLVKGQKIAKFFYPTMSDKTTMVIVESFVEDVGKLQEGEVVTDTAVNKIYEQVAKAEILRIQAHQNRNTKPNIKGYNQGAGMFLMLPTLNNIADIWVTVDGKRELVADITPYETQIKAEIRRVLAEGVKDKINQWEQFKLIKEDGSSLFGERYQKVIGKKYPEGTDIYPHMALEYVTNYMLNNSNLFQSFIGDPALFYKSKSSNAIQRAKDTFNNIGKRLAGDLAPGYEIADTPNNNFKLGFLADRESISTRVKYYTKILDGTAITNEEIETLATGTKSEIAEIKKRYPNAKDYFSVEGTDAQEFTTWQEHIYVMYKAGKLEETDYNKAKELLSAGKILPTDLLGKVMQPMKPVYVNNKIVDGIDRRIYVKSSSFPLMPQMTAGLEIDKLRIAMERDGIDRVAFGTAVKVGNTGTPLDIWNDDGSVKDEIAFDAKNSLELTREGFRIQQEVPYKEEKAKVGVGTQERKLLFNNILDVGGFQYEGKTMDGKELLNEYNDVWEKIYRMKYDEFIQEIEYNGTSYNKDKLAKILQKEALERGYDLNTTLSLITDNGRFPIPLWALPAGNRIESLVTSLVNNRINKTKMPGRSYVLGTEEGFTTNKKLVDKPEEVDKLLKKYASEIVFTSSWTGKLEAHNVEGGKFKPTQVMVPWNFRDENGKLLNIQDYTVEVDGKIMLDEAKVPKELRQLFGFRIPTQGHNSMNMLEIVGFLPKEAGDLLLASRDFTIQMGSDFDIDKLYTYMYNHVVRDGKLYKVIEEFDTDQEKILQNNLLDIHFSVLSNPDTKVQSLIAAPLAFGDLPTIADKIAAVRESKGTFNPLSDTYQREYFIQNTAGKAGVGVFSLDSTFNALAQQFNLSFKGEDAKTPFRTAFGNQKTSGDLSGAKTLDGKKYKSDVIAAFQSAAVDNANENILGKINVNNHTFDVIRTFAQLGFDETTIATFVAQDIIVDYVNEVIALSSSLDEFSPTARQDAYENVLSKYNASKYTEIDASLADQSASKLYEYISQGRNSKDGRYEEAQIAILDKFLVMSDYGKSLQALQSTINSDSAGLGKSIVANQIKLQQVFRMADSKINGATDLIGDFTYKDPTAPAPEGYTYIYTDVMTDKNGQQVMRSLYVKPTTINGFATVLGAATVNNVFGEEFPYASKVFTNAVDEIAEVTDNTNLSNAQKESLYKKVFNAFKSYLFSSNLLTMDDADAVRNRLLYDKYEYQETESSDKVNVRKSAGRYYFDVNGTNVYSTGNMVASVRFSKFILRKDGDVWKKYDRELVHTQKSLASRIKELQNTPLGINNKFLNKVTVDINKDGSPSIVKFNAAASENFDENAIYASFVKLLTDDKEISDGYTTTDLAEDMIMYSYYTGGVQQAIQFIKYVPVGYLKTVGFGRKLNEINFENAEELNIFEHPEYFQVTNFTKQYIQHNPWDITILKDDLSQITNADSKSPTNVTNFTLKDRDLYVDVADDNGLVSSVPPAFLSWSHKGKWYLYQYNGAEYQKIPVFNHFGVSEYNVNRVENVKRELQTATGDAVDASTENTVVNSEQPTEFFDEEITYKMPTEAEKASSKDKTVDNPTYKTDTFTELKNNVKEGNLQAVLDNIIDNSTNDQFAAYARQLKEIVKKYKIKLIVNNDLNARGRNTLIGDEAHVQINLRRNQTTNRLETALLHELTHAVTAKLIYAFERNPDSLTTAQKARIKRLEAFRQAFIEKMGREKMRDFFNRLEAAKELADKGEKYSDLVSNEEMQTLYAGANLREFVAVIMTSPELQEFMRSEIWQGDKTWWSRFVDLIQKIFDSIGIKFGDDLTKLAFEDILAIARNTDTVAQQTRYDVLEEFTDPTQSEVSTSITLSDGTVFETGLPFALNEQQEKAAVDAIDFVKNNKAVFTLAGSAGTGKTTITKVILKYISQLRQPYAVAAPTHQAKQVIANLSGKDAMTVAKLIGLQPNMELSDFNLANVTFSQQNEPGMPRSGFVIIDEVSMINDELYDYILQLAAEKNTKVIFIGDPAQIKPVKQRNIAKAFREGSSATLTKVMRTANGNPIVSSVLTPIRDNQNKKHDSFAHITQLNKNGEGISFTTSNESWLQKGAKQFDKDFKEGVKTRTRFVAYTNKRVSALNKAVRQKLFGQDAPQLVKGEIIKGYRSLFYDTPKRDYHFHNSGEYEIKSVDKVTKNMAGIEVSGYSIVLEDVFTKKVVYQNLFVADNNNISLEYLNYLDKLKNDALKAKKYDKGQAWRRYYSAAERYQLMSDVYIYQDRAFTDRSELKLLIAEDNPKMSNSEVERKINRLKSKDKDLDYGYASTAHKMQGSTFENVFVDENNIDIQTRFENPDYDNWHKIKYVAFSRASKNAYVLSNKTEIPQNDFMLSPMTTTVERDIEKKNGLRNKDGSRKRYLLNNKNYKKLLAKAQELNNTLVDHTAKIIKVMGEKGDSRVYYALAVYPVQTDYMLDTEDKRRFSDLELLLEQQIRRLDERLSIVKKQIRDSANKDNKKALIARSQRLEDKIESKKEDLQTLIDKGKLDFVKDLLFRQLKEVEAMLNQPKLAVEEIDYAQRIIKFAKQAGTIESDNHIILDEFEIEDMDIVADFQEFKALAETLNRTLSAIQEQTVTDFINNKLGTEYTKETITAAIKDVTGLAANTLDISRYGDDIASAISLTLKEQEFRALEQSRSAWKKIDDLLDKAMPKLKALNSLNPFQLFQQRTEDGLLTGDLVYYFSDKFFADSRKVRNTIAKIKKNPAGKDGVLSAKQKRDLTKLRNKQKAMSMVFDVRKLFPRPANAVGFSPKFTEADKEAHIEELKQQVGTKLFEKYYNRLQSKVDQFELDFDIYREEVRNDGSLNEQEKEDKIELWEKENSPYYAAVNEIDLEPVKFGNNYVFTKGNWKYSYSVPRRFNAKGERTGYYDENYLQIEKDEDIYNFYSYVIDKLYEMQQLIPEHKKSDWHINTLPTIRKDILEKFSENKLGASKALYDSLIEMTRRSDVSDIDYAERDAEGNPIKRVQLNMATNRKQIAEIVKLKTNNYLVNNPGMKVTDSMIAQWRAEAKDEVAREKSFDLGKVMKAYIAQVTSYHHKTVVEDITNLMIDTAFKRKEIVTNVAGVPLKNPKTGEVVVQEGLPNMKAAINYYRDVLYGLPHHAIEGKTEIKRYTTGEKKTKQEIEELLVKNQKNLDAGRITNEEYIKIKDDLNKQLGELGGNVIGSKVGDMLLKWIQLKGMGWNIPSAISNMGFGLIANLVEAADGRLFSQGQYFTAMKMVLNSIGKNLSFHTFENDTAMKIRNMMDRFDFAKDASTELYRASNRNSITKKGRFLNPYQLQMRSEYVNQAPIMIAIAMNTKLKDLGVGMDGNLWEAMNADGSWNTEKYGEQPDLSSFKIKVDQTIKRTHGNYDSASPIKGKEKILGRALLQFRTWMLEGFASRWQEEQFDRALNIKRKGRYRSYAAIVKEMGPIAALLFTSKQLARKMMFKQTQFGDVLNDVDAANMRANLQELVILLGISTIALLLKASIEDDDDDSIVANILINQATRLQTDILFYTNPIEFNKLVRDPLPVMSLVGDTANLMDAIGKTIVGDPYMKAGIYKDQPRIFVKGSKLVPIGSQIHRLGSYTLQTWDD